MPFGSSVNVPPSNVTAAVLAGGGSTRFGSDKALARLPGEDATFLERAVVIARSVAVEVLIIAPERHGYRAAEAPILPDRFPGEGPAGGILTALLSATTTWLLALSCDQPYIAVRDLKALLSADQTAPALAFQSSSGGVHPLPCALRVEPCLPIVESAFAEGYRSLKHLLTRCGVTGVPIEGAEIERRLLDIDSPTDLPEGELA